MLTFKLISVVDGFYHYEIYPEGKEADKGWIVFNPDKKIVKERVEPNTPFNWIGHFFDAAKDKNGNYKKEGMAAWY